MFARPRNRRERSGPWVELTGPVPLSEQDERAIFAVLDYAIARAGRSSVMMALRGSRAEKVRRLDLVGKPGHGHFAGLSEEDVLAKIDTFFHRGWLRFERTRDGLPLICYTDDGLEKATRFVVEQWLEELRGQLEAVAGGAPLALSFLMSVSPQRNQDSVLRLTDEVERVADARWLPLLRAWCAAETKRVRGRLQPLIARLEAGA